MGMAVTVEDQIQQLRNAVEQQQNVLQQQQTQLGSLTTQLADAVQRAQQAEADRSRLIEIAASRQGELVDTKGVGQPFKFSGKSDNDFSEWNHKMLTFLRAKYGPSIVDPLKWAVRQRKTVVKEIGTLDANRVSAWDPEFGSTADALDQVENIDSIVGGLYTYLVAFTTGDANKIVRNSGPDGLECWRRLHVEYDPTSSMRRVAILGLVQNPPKCKSVDELGQALADWLGKKRQYEEFTDRNGSPCTVSEDSLMAALYRLMPSSLEEAVMFRAEDYPSFSDLFDKLSTYASTKHSLFLTQRDLGGGGGRSSNKPDPNAMDVSAMAKGKGKEKGKFKGKCNNCGRPGHKAADCKGSSSKGKGKSSPKDNVRCWVCEGYGHYGKDCPSQKNSGKGKGSTPGKGKGKGGKSDGQHGSHSGKGRNNASSVEEPEADPPKGADLGYLDLNSCDVDYPPYVVDYGGDQWIRINYDSGAAATVFPVGMVANDVDLKEDGQYTVASGGSIARYGSVRMRVEDECGNSRSMAGSVAGVHKPLGSAAEFSKGHDCLLWDSGGMLVPKQGKLALELRKAFDDLYSKFADGTEMPIHREGNLYNFYVKKSGPIQEVNAVGTPGKQSGKSRLA